MAQHGGVLGGAASASFGDEAPHGDHAPEHEVDISPDRRPAEVVAITQVGLTSVIALATYRRGSAVAVGVTA